MGQTVARTSQSPHRLADRSRLRASPLPSCKDISTRGGVGIPPFFALNIRVRVQAVPCEVRRNDPKGFLLRPEPGARGFLPPKMPKRQPGTSQRPRTQTTRSKIAPSPSSLSFSLLATASLLPRSPNGPARQPHPAGPGLRAPGIGLKVPRAGYLPGHFPTQALCTRVLGVGFSGVDS